MSSEYGGEPRNKTVLPPTPPLPPFPCMVYDSATLRSIRQTRIGDNPPRAPPLPPKGATQTETRHRRGSADIAPLLALHRSIQSYKTSSQVHGWPQASPPLLRSVLYFPSGKRPRLYARPVVLTRPRYTTIEEASQEPGLKEFENTSVGDITLSQADEVLKPAIERIEEEGIRRAKQEFIKETPGIDEGKLEEVEKQQRMNWKWKVKNLKVFELLSVSALLGNHTELPDREWKWPHIVDEPVAPDQRAAMIEQLRNRIREAMNTYANLQKIEGKRQCEFSKNVLGTTVEPLSTNGEEVEIWNERPPHSIMTTGGPQGSWSPGGFGSTRLSGISFKTASTVHSPSLANSLKFPREPPHSHLAHSSKNNLTVILDVGITESPTDLVPEPGKDVVPRELPSTDDLETLEGPDPNRTGALASRPELIPKPLSVPPKISPLPPNPPRTPPAVPPPCPTIDPLRARGSRAVPSFINVTGIQNEIEAGISKATDEQKLDLKRAMSRKKDKNNPPTSGLRRVLQRSVSHRGKSSSPGASAEKEARRKLVNEQNALKATSEICLPKGSFENAGSSSSRASPVPSPSQSRSITRAGASPSRNESPRSASNKASPKLPSSSPSDPWEPQRSPRTAPRGRSPLSSPSFPDSSTPPASSLLKRSIENERMMSTRGRSRERRNPAAPRNRQGDNRDETLRWKRKVSEKSTRAEKKRPVALDLSKGKKVEATEDDKAGDASARATEESPNLATIVMGTLRRRSDNEYDDYESP